MTLAIESWTINHDRALVSDSVEWTAEPREQWMDDALCATTDPELFFPGTGYDGEQQEAAAKQVCGRCAVRDECLRFALANGERFGVWGGLSEAERRDALPIPVSGRR